MGTFFCSLDISCGDLEQSPAESVQNHHKSAECETGWKSESDATEQKVFEVKERATSCGGLCSLVGRVFKSGCFSSPLVTFWN